MQPAVGPEMRCSFPSACLQRGSVLNDEKRGGIEPDEGGEAGRDAQERDAGSPRLDRLSGRGAEDSHQAQDRGRHRLDLRRRCEKLRNVSEEITDPRT